MLIEFSVANFRSLRDRQTLSLMKAAGGELIDTNTFKAGASHELPLLRSAALYGANAGGKSNFLRALRAMKTIVLGSASSLKPVDRLPVAPFRLSSATRDAPSEFEVTFIVNEIRYQYGFAASPDRIHREWLLAFPKGRRQRWVERAWNGEAQSYEWGLGNNLAGERQLWQKSTRENALFLSTAVQLNSEQLKPIYDWFKTTLRMANVSGWSPEFSASLCEKGGKARVMDYLRAADLSIDDIVVERKPFDPKALPSDMPTYVKEAIETQFKEKPFVDIKTVHKSRAGEAVVFDIEDEFDGTQKLFAFAGPWIDSLTNGFVLFIDELHDNLHPRLVRFLVNLFHSNATNTKKRPADLHDP